MSKQSEMEQIVNRIVGKNYPDLRKDEKENFSHVLFEVIELLNNSMIEDAEKLLLEKSEKWVKLL